jgi:cell division protease FtsH
MAKQNNNQENKNNNNNFFNNNPLLAFALFSIVIILIFKSFVGDSGGIGNMLDSSNNVTQTKTVKYSEIKSEIEKGSITSVKLTPTTIEAIADVDGRKTRFIAQNVPTYDKDLIPLLEEKHITYEGIMGGGFLSDLLGSLLPILIFFAIWIFLAK